MLHSPYRTHPSSIPGKVSEVHLNQFLSAATSCSKCSKCSRCTWNRHTTPVSKGFARWGGLRRFSAIFPGHVANATTLGRDGRNNYTDKTISGNALRKRSWILSKSTIPSSKRNLHKLAIRHVKEACNDGRNENRLPSVAASFDLFPSWATTYLHMRDA